MSPREMQCQRSEEYVLCFHTTFKSLETNSISCHSICRLALSISRCYHPNHYCPSNHWSYDHPCNRDRYYYLCSHDCYNYYCPQQHYRQPYHNHYPFNCHWCCCHWLRCQRSRCCWCRRCCFFLPINTSFTWLNSRAIMELF